MFPPVGGVWMGCPKPSPYSLLGRRFSRSRCHRMRKRILFEGGNPGIARCFGLKALASATCEDYSHSVNSEKPSQPTLGETEISTT